jgi:hypothetical protein
MMSALVTEAIGDSNAPPVKLLLRMTCDHSGRKTLTLRSGCSYSSASMGAIKAYAVL